MLRRRHSISSCFQMIVRIFHQKTFVCVADQVLELRYSGPHMCSYLADFRAMDSLVVLTLIMMWHLEVLLGEYTGRQGINSCSFF